MDKFQNIRERSVASSSLLCIATLAALLTLYKFTDNPVPADNILTTTTSGSNTASSTGPGTADTSEPRLANTTISRAAPTLQLLVLVSRHGNRATEFVNPVISLYPVSDTDIWPFGQAQLTKRGRVQMYKLGRKIRSLYDGFLNKHYLPVEFQAYSTNRARNMMSAELFLAGLFPPTGYQVWNKDLLWQSVPVFTTYIDHVGMLTPVNAVKCPRFHEAQNKSVAEFKVKFGPTIRNLTLYLRENIGLDVQNVPVNVMGPDPALEALAYIQDTLVSAENEGLKLPSWTKNIYPEPLQFVISKMANAYGVASDTQIRLLEGELFKEIIRLLQDKVDDAAHRRQMRYFTCHDNTIVGLMHILGLTNFKHSDATTGSVIIFELHQDPQTRNHYVQVLYIDGTSEDLEPAAVSIPGCDFPCDFSQLKNITEKYYNITDWEKECQIS